MTYRTPKEFESVSQEVDLMLYIWVCVCGPLCLTVPLLQWVYVLHLLRNMYLPAPLRCHAVHLQCVRVLSQLILPLGHLCYVERRSKGWVATLVYLFRGLIKGPGCAQCFWFSDSLWVPFSNYSKHKKKKHTSKAPWRCSFWSFPLC